MSNGNIYTWEINEEAYLSQDKTYDLNDLIFRSCKPLDEYMKGDEYRQWVKGLMPPPNMFANQKENTDRWYQSKSAIKASYLGKKADVEQLDVFTFKTGIPTVSPRIYSVLMDMCPNEFESYDVIINTQNGQVLGYKIINVLNTIFDMVDLDESVFSGAYYSQESNRVLVRNKDDMMSFHKERQLGKIHELHTCSFSYLVLKKDVEMPYNMARFGEAPLYCIFSQQLIDAFRSLQINGFLYSTIEDRLSRLSIHYKGDYWDKKDKKGNQ